MIHTDTDRPINSFQRTGVRGGRGLGPLNSNIGWRGTEKIEVPP